MKTRKSYNALSHSLIKEFNSSIDLLAIILKAHEDPNKLFNEILPIIELQITKSDENDQNYNKKSVNRLSFQVKNTSRPDLTLIVAIKNMFLSNSLLIIKVVEKLNEFTIKKFVNCCV